MDEQQHVQGQPPARANPFRRGDRVRLNPKAAGAWGKRRRMVGYVTEDPGDYLVPVVWVVEGSTREQLVRDALAEAPIVTDGAEAFHFGWLEHAPLECDGGGELQTCD